MNGVLTLNLKNNRRFKKKPNYKKRILTAVIALVLAVAVIFAVFSGKNEKSPTVCIDPGHGGDDFGTVNYSDTRSEKDDNLRLALLVKGFLEENGAKVILTRSDDSEVTLEKRCKTANRQKADCFVCLHRNGSDNPEAEGVEIWIAASPTDEEELLAKNISEAIVNVGVSVNRGIKTGYRDESAEDFYINANTTMPSCLVELLFVTNDSDNSLFDENITAYAKAIAEAILETYK